MACIRYLSLAILVLILCSDAYSQEYAFRHYTSDDIINPLPASSSYDIMQDHEGFIWFSVIGGGLNRFDGRTFETMSANPDFLPDLDFVVGLHQPPDHYLWAQTTGGLVVSTQPLYEGGLHKRPVFTDSLESKNGYIKLFKGDTLAYGPDAFATDPHTNGVWVATGSSGIIHYRKNETNIWRADTLLPSAHFPDLGESVNDVYSVLLRESGELVFVARGGYIGVLTNEQRISFLDGNTSVEWMFKKFNEDKEFGIHISLFEDDKQRLWSWTTTGKLWMLEGAVYDKITSTFFEPDYHEELGSIMVFTIHQDTQKNLWAGTSAGFGFLHFENGQPFRILSGVGTSGTNRIQTDNEGNIWVGTHAGIFKFRENFQAFQILKSDEFPFTRENEIVAVSGDPNDDSVIWMGSSRGIIRAEKQITGYHYDLYDSKTIGLEPYVYSIEPHPDGSVWVGKNNGFSIFRKLADLSSDVHLKNLDPSYSGNLPNGLHVTSFSINHSAGHISHQIFKDEVITFIADNSNITTIYQNELIPFGRVIDHPRPGINSIQIGPDGHLWISTVFEGMIRSIEPIGKLIVQSEILVLDPEQQMREVMHLFEPVIVDNKPATGSVYGPVFLDDGFLISTPIGVLVYEPDKADTTGLKYSKIAEVTEKEGLNHNFPGGLRVNKEQNMLWTGGPKGINAIDLDTFEVIVSKGKKDGMVEEFLWNTNAFDLFDGQLLYGTGKGLIAYNYELDKKVKKQLPSIRITEIDFVEKAFGGNQFIAQFAAPSYTNETEITFKYRLLGFDKDWVDSGRNTSSRYTNLSSYIIPKNYTFEVIAVNENGETSLYPDTYTFKVSPPVYASWWFLLLAFGGAFVSVVKYIGHRDRKNKAKQEELAINRQFEIMQRVGASMAHDMKNSVFSLTFLSRNLEKRFENKEFRNDAIDTLQKTTSHLNNLIQRFQQQKLTWDINPNKSDIQETISTVIKRCAVLAHDKVKVNFSPKESIQWMHDAAALERILENLLKNAIEASGNGGVVQIELEEVIRNRFITIRIKDEGCGMTKEFIEDKLFQPFNSTKKQGIGLGIYSAKELVTAHGGTIKVNSDLGVGTTFELIFFNTNGKTA